MEKLTEKVYECTLAVEAHMICDLLSQAGISARVDGEFLQGASGEIPLGNAIKVRVDPARVAEAREVIADWEKLQPAEATALPQPKRSRLTSPLWFFAGVMVGIALVFAVFHQRLSTADFEEDRNEDGRIDFRWTYRWNGDPLGYEEDNDYDGRFELKFEVGDDGHAYRSILDADGDGRPDEVTQFTHGVATESDYYSSGGRVVKRLFYKAGEPDYAEFDDDGDGTFKRRVKYDSRGDPQL